MSLSAELVAPLGKSLLKMAEMLDRQEGVGEKKKKKVRKKQREHQGQRRRKMYSKEEQIFPKGLWSKEDLCWSKKRVRRKERPTAVS